MKTALEKLKEVAAPEQRIPRDRMIERLGQHYGVRDLRVLEAMAAVPRHLFVPDALRSRAYGDHALPIDANQTISQPFIVARMSELLALKPDDRVLEIGAGSGYQTAVLAMLAGQVYSIERVADLARTAQTRIRELGIHNATVKCFDGTMGWTVHSPYDAIIVAAGGPEIPKPLMAQLKIGGRLVLPIGETRAAQRLILVKRDESGYVTEDHGPCAFVPLIGRHGWPSA
ncbi:MAG: protein-L-isoaspartate(D-aspartate) O-methyltransferase [Pyrinomonadaceae bacterium]